MKFADQRAEGIALIREHARQQAAKGDIRQAHLDLKLAMQALLEEFRVEFDVPGVRYWHYLDAKGQQYITTAPGEEFPPGVWNPIEIERHVFLARQDLHFGYDDRL